MDNQPPLEIGPEHPDFQRVYEAQQKAEYAKQAADPHQRLKMRLMGLGLLLLGAGGLWFNWHELTTEGSFYIAPVVLCPAALLLGLVVILIGRDFRIVGPDRKAKPWIKACGVIFGVLWLSSAGWLAYYFETYEPPDPNFLAKAAAGMGRGLPRMDSATVQLDSITAGPGEKLTITYTLMDRVAGPEADLSAKADLMASLKESDCKETGIKRVLDHGAPIDYRYLGHDGRPIVEVRLTAAACK